MPSGPPRFRLIPTHPAEGRAAAPDPETRRRTNLLIPEHVPNLAAIIGPLLLVAIGSGLAIMLMIHRDDIPEVFGDRSRLVQVLQNLLDNSAKFLGDQKAPRIVEVHGGKVWVESAGKGQGTTVCFTLPTREPV